MDNKNPSSTSSAAFDSSIRGYSEWKNKFLRIVLLVASGFFLIVIVTAWSTNNIVTNVIYLVLVALLAAVALFKTPYTVQASALIFTLFYAGTVLLVTWGVKGEAMAVYLAAFVLAALLFERPVEYFVIVLVVITVLGTAYATLNETNILSGWSGLGSLFYSAVVGTWTDWIIYLVDLLGLGIITIAATRMMKSEFNNILVEANANQNELVESRYSLEARVEERTRELIKATQDIERTSKQTAKRADQLIAVADVSKTIASVRDIDLLMDTIVVQISERFGFYHTGIYLKNDDNSFAVLKAASSPGGKRMIARGHRLKIGAEGIVGYVTDTGKPRVALDTGADQNYFKNPELPGTRSELAIPLVVGNQIIGALDVQSNLPNAFQEDDIQIMTTLASQVAIAINNATLFTETQKALSEAQSAYQKFVETGWSYFMGQSAQVGFQFSNNQIQPLSKPLDRPEITTVMESGEPVSDETSEFRLAVPTLAVPIKVRGETIGVVDIRSINPNRTWDSTDLATAQTISDRLAFALENARLIDESQKRVARERAISEMTTRIGTSTDVDTILQQTVQELGKLIGNSEVVIQFARNEASQEEDFDHVAKN